MAVSKTSLVNKALTLAGATPITNITDDTTGLGIIYTYYLDDPSKYSSAFVEAFIDKLCSDIGYMIINDK